MRLDQQARSLIKRLQPDAPVNIVGIAKVLGLGVWEARDLPDTISGMFSVIGFTKAR